MVELKDKGVSYGNLETFAGAMKQKYAKKGELPTKVSDLTNDAGYQTGEQVAATVAAAVAAADHLTRKIVESVEAIDTEAEGADKFIYMVPNGSGKNKDKYDEYMLLSGELEKVGNTQVDLSGYAQTEQVASDIDAAKAAAVEEADANTDEKLEGYVKTTDIETATEEEILALFEDDE